ncbi:hypothetical protein M011DRAFT_467856 [Sporormia fimetaria CBS 119925]|uniref:HMG box domain-containing protein n=1 Tax=Sporormia fimetaria CBS 119925 TaxID=1340428 RepID=A0A6A6VDS9_9PLEO|nr:hypothetical protein M011DRAFT_467856 [Sporormia fimetaria CBS 119925]
MDENDRRTRSGRTIAPATPPPQTNKPRAKSASRSKKAKTGKADKPKTPKLTMPLSILTKDMASVPVRDMREWVNRSAEERRKEVEKRNGYVTRPMNSFMLYRSAYAERTKQWCLQNNHQVVSSVSGESWPMEPPEVRELYNEYAKIERMNHQNAHPNYKFSPSKTAAPAKKRKEEFSEEEPSDFEDAEWGPGIRRVSHRSRRARPIGNEHLSISMAGPSYDIFGRPFTANGDGPDRAAWDMNHVGRPMALPMQGDLYNQYFQPDMHPGMGMDPTMVEELQRQASFSGLHFSPGQAMLGLPGGNVADMMQHLHSGMGTPLGDEGQVDPMLLAFDGAHHADMTSAMLSHSGFRDGHLDLLNQDLGHDKQSMPDGYTSEQWHSDPSMPVMEQGSEFEKWMDDH